MDHTRAAPQTVLARLAPQIPTATALPGGSRYEPKWDGWRLIATRGDKSVRLWSRRGADLTARLPDVAAAVAAQTPTGVTLDGEVVVWRDGRLNFPDLQRRLSTGVRSIGSLAAQRPASYVAFDVLEVAGRDVRGLAWRNRRLLLEELANTWHPPLYVSPVTSDPAEAAEWFNDMAVAGIEGLVVKGADQPYRGGQRDWIKVKSRSTLDVVCAAVLGPLSQPTVVVTGLPIGESSLRIVGRTSPLQTRDAMDLGQLLKRPGLDHPWPPVVPASRVHGMGSGRDPVELTRVQPIVVEVSADTAWSGSSFRHPLRFLRPRPELDPAHVQVPDVLRRPTR